MFAGQLDPVSSRTSPFFGFTQARIFSVAACAAVVMLNKTNAENVIVLTLMWPPLGEMAHANKLCNSRVRWESIESLGKRDLSLSGVCSILRRTHNFARLDRRILAFKLQALE
jgi:hypothetical protein